MENVVETVETTVEPVAEPVYTGIARTINGMIETLIEAREAAVELESGLTTKVALNRASVKARGALQNVKDDIFWAREDIHKRKTALLATVEEVAAADKKDKLAAQIAELTSKYEAL